MGNSIALVMMAGLPGAGKATLAYALGHELQWQVVDKDEYIGCVPDPISLPISRPIQPPMPLLILFQAPALR